VGGDLPGSQPLPVAVAQQRSHRWHGGMAAGQGPAESAGKGGPSGPGEGTELAKEGLYGPLLWGPHSLQGAQGSVPGACPAPFPFEGAISPSFVSFLAATSFSRLSFQQQQAMQAQAQQALEQFGSGGTAVGAPWGGEAGAGGAPDPAYLKALMAHPAMGLLLSHAQAMMTGGPSGGVPGGEGK